MSELPQAKRMVFRRRTRGESPGVAGASPVGLTARESARRRHPTAPPFELVHHFFKR